MLQAIRDVEHVSGHRPTLILEATGHYQSPVVQFLEEHHYLFIVIHLLISNRLRKSNLRKVKTDAADAYLLGDLYYREEFEPYKNRGVQLLNLRYLTRQYEAFSKMCVQTKLQFQAVLDQVFPAYKGVPRSAFYFLQNEVAQKIGLTNESNDCSMQQNKIPFSKRCTQAT